MNDNIPANRFQFDAVEIGIGTWSWGDRFYWGFGQGYSEKDLKDAYQASLDGGIRFFDTAEVYGSGKSETYLGRFIQERRSELVIASKFMPFPWKLARGSLLRSLRRSLIRLQIPYLDLYQMHFPLPPITVETWMDGMIEAFQSGLVRAVGVSNYTPAQTQRAYDRLIGAGIRLASNQVEYHLLDRSIERSGLKDLCQSLGVKIIAYSPLAMGLLTGKYTPENPPSGFRGMRFSRSRLSDIQPLIKVLKRIGEAHDGKTPAQVAINWTICKGTLPIPGAKNASQARQNAAAAGWRLTATEVAELDEVSDRLTPSLTTR